MPPTPTPMTIKKASAENSTARPAPSFLVGPPAKRSLRRLLQSTTDPAQTIQDFQNSNSIHSMFAKAFHTTPTHELPKTSHTTTRKRAKTMNASDVIKKPESFQPQSALQFLHHIGGVKQADVHKKIADTILKALEVEIGRTTNNESLLKLLRSCWTPANSAVELRPVVIAVIKKLGDDTPDAVLQRLSERDSSGKGKGKDLLYGELMNSFDIKIRRLIWEADWNRCVKESEEGGSALKDANSLLVDLLTPELDRYANDKVLVSNANALFVTTVGERRVMTQNRRYIDSIRTTGAVVKQQQKPSVSATAIAKILEIIGDRPKLLTSLLFQIISYHTEKASDGTFLGGSSSSSGLTCTLFSDVILSYRQLPRSFEHLIILATILDRSVKAGILQDDIIAQIQGCLRVVFHNTSTATTTKNTNNACNTTQSSAASSSGSSKTAFSSSSKKRYSTDHDMEFVQSLLQKVISAALTAMKTSDPQCLFLNPVTDEIAPGYSQIVTKPMCIKTMYDQRLKHYKSLPEWEKDVQLMFQNCITYNIGKDGAWFRGESKRQNKSWRDNVYAQAKELYKKEVAKRKKAWEKINIPPVTAEKKKDATTTSNTTTAPRPIKEKKPTLLQAIKNQPPIVKKGVDKEAVLHLTAKDIMPLAPTPKPPSIKKRKNKEGDYTTTNKNLIPTTSSLLPTLACMILSDPFVVRLIIDKILRFIRTDIVPSKSLPYSHTILPSLLQFLYLIQNTWGYCNTLGKRFYIPSCGMEELPSDNDTKPKSNDTRPYVFLRSMIPLLTKLTLDVKLDERFSLGGDLYDTTTTTTITTTTTTHHSISSVNDWKEYIPILSSSNQVLIIRALVQGIFLSILPPGYTLNDIALGKQMTRCMELLELFCTNNETNSSNKSNVVVLEQTFWQSFSKVILKYKSKLPATIRDWIIAFYIKCLTKNDYFGKNKIQLLKSFIWLLNEWCTYGNQIMARDLLFTTCENALDVTYPSTNFQMAWVEAKEEFLPIQNQFVRMLKNVPDSYANSWKEKMGIDDDSLEKARRKDGSSSNSMVKEEDCGDEGYGSEGRCVVKMEEDVMEEN